MLGLPLLRGISDVVARLAVRPVQGGQPTARLQDKRREVRPGRLAAERRQIGHCARGATWHDSLPILHSTLSLHDFAHLARPVP
jgi:hypothetical protein